MTVPLAKPPRPPEAFNDSVTTDEDTAVTIDLLANDELGGVDRSQFSVAISSPPSDGKLRNNGDGSATYCPASSAPAVDSFSYLLQAPSGTASTEATVRITRNPLSGLPIARDDYLVVPSGLTVVLAVFDNDVFSGGPRVTIDTLPALGTLGNQTSAGVGINTPNLAEASHEL